MSLPESTVSLGPSFVGGTKCPGTRCVLVPCSPTGPHHPFWRGWVVISTLLTVSSQSQMREDGRGAASPLAHPHGEAAAASEGGAVAGRSTQPHFPGREGMLAAPSSGLPGSARPASCSIPSLPDSSLPCTERTHTSPRPGPS